MTVPPEASREQTFGDERIANGRVRRRRPRAAAVRSVAGGELPARAATPA